MQTFKNILYVSCSTQDQTQGLKQAISLSRNNQATLTVMIVCPKFPKGFADYQEKFESELVNQMEKTIQTTKASLSQPADDLKVAVELLIHKTPSVGIIKHVLKHGHDLVIKEAEAQSNREGFRALDMELSRKCPTPVWICQPIASSGNSMHIGVAVDPQGDEPSANQLSIDLLKSGRELADFCDGTLNIVSCWDFGLENDLRESAFLKTDSAKVDAFVEQEQAEHLASLERLIEQAGITGDNQVHHLRGKADDLIPKFVKDHGIDVLVMGTVARTGIEGFIFGNTAENIMQNISSSLVAMKPSTFVSPVKP